MGKSIVQVNDFLQVQSSGHILYLFEDDLTYLENAVAYIATAIKYGHHTLLIESEGATRLIVERISDSVTEEARNEYVHCVDNEAFYENHGDFHCRSIINHFSTYLQPFLSSGVTVRTWANVFWTTKDDIVSKLEEFEQMADKEVHGLDLMSVCAYRATGLSASLLTTMLRTHEFYMTDRELVKSPLYWRTSS